MKRQININDDDKPDREINARFRERLPSILETLCCSYFTVEEPLGEASIAVREFLDYLDFEIHKVSLSIERAEWESVVDKAALDADREWLSRLIKLRHDFSHGVNASSDYINNLVDNIRSTFKY